MSKNNGTEPRHQPTWTNSLGREIKLRPVSQVRQQQLTQTVIKRFREAGEPIDPPKYKVIDVAGTEEWFDHTKETIETAGEEEKVAWTAHKAALKRLQQEITTRTTKLLLLEGLEIEEPTEEWESRQRYWDIPVPDDPFEKKIEYIVTEILPTPWDQTECILAVMKAGSAGLDDEVMAAAEDSFRRTIHTESKRRSRAALEQLAAQEGALAAPGESVNTSYLEDMVRATPE